MSSKKINSRNTQNPYELISEIKLISKHNKNIKIELNATDFSYDIGENGKRNLVMNKFIVNKKYSKISKSDYETIKIFNSIKWFSRLCKNKLEIITLFIDAYKKNKDVLSIKIKTCLEYPDMLDSKFVYDSLINN